MSSKHWWEDRVQPGMLFVSKTHLYCGGAHVPGSPGLLDPGAPALVVGTERVGYNRVFEVMVEGTVHRLHPLDVEAV